MPRVKPEGMDDELWAAVCIVMDDHQIRSFNDMTASHQAVIERMDQMETKWSEYVAQPASQGATDAGTQGASGQGTGAPGTGEPGGATTPPPVVEKEEEKEGEKKGSGRGGKPRWYETDRYAS